MAGRDRGCTSHACAGAPRPGSCRSKLGSRRGEDGRTRVPGRPRDAWTDEREARGVRIDRQTGRRTEERAVRPGWRGGPFATPRTSAGGPADWKGLVGLRRTFRPLAIPRLLEILASGRGLLELSLQEFDHRKGGPARRHRRAQGRPCTHHPLTTYGVVGRRSLFGQPPQLGVHPVQSFEKVVRHEERFVKPPRFDPSLRPSLVTGWVHGRTPGDGFSTRIGTADRRSSRQRRLDSI